MHVIPFIAKMVPPPPDRTTQYCTRLDHWLAELPGGDRMSFLLFESARWENHYALFSRLIDCPAIQNPRAMDCIRAIAEVTRRIEALEGGI